jgi:NAD+ diphosphatase
LTFSRPQHERAAQRRKDQDWLDRRWREPGTRVIVVDGGRVAADPSTGAVRWIDTSSAGPGERYLLGLDDADGAVFAVHRDGLDSDASLGLRELALSSSADDLQWACHAVALAQWHDSHGFCARCGHPTEVSAAGAERRCPSDGSAHFPRVDPAVIVLVTDADDRALLGHQAAWPEGRFSTLAGFVEPGESAEHAVVREVAEESGVPVQDVRLLATQPWPFPSSLMIGATAIAVGSPRPQPDGDELEQVRWFSRGELAAAVASGSVQVPGLISISRWLIDRWFGADLPDEGAGWR